jgi:hypothetical protein
MRNRHLEAMKVLLCTWICMESAKRSKLLQDVVPTSPVRMLFLVTSVHIFP